jgi:hypothetical protein
MEKEKRERWIKVRVSETESQNYLCPLGAVWKKKLVFFLSLLRQKVFAQYLR